MPLLAGGDEREGVPEALLQVLQCIPRGRVVHHLGLLKPLEDRGDSESALLDLMAVLLVLLNCLHGLVDGEPNFDDLHHARCQYQYRPYPGSPDALKRMSARSATDIQISLHKIISDEQTS